MPPTGNLNTLSRGRSTIPGGLHGSPIRSYEHTQQEFDRAMMMKAHILIVDDDSRVISALRRTLAYEGYQVSTATNGEGALALARTRPPDLVILDLMLPGIDG